MPAPTSPSGESKFKALVRTLSRSKGKVKSSRCDVHCTLELNDPPPIAFPCCPHTTPPTPRPRDIPPVLKTEVLTPVSSGTGSGQPGRDHVTDSNVDVEAEDNNGDATNAYVHPHPGTPLIRQVLSSPRRCLDCSLAYAADAARMVHEAFDALIADAYGGAYTNTHTTETAARSNARDTNVDTTTNTNPSVEVNFNTRDDFDALKARRDAELRAIWTRVHDEWDGAVRSPLPGEDGEEVLRVRLVEGDALRGVRAEFDWS